MAQITVNLPNFKDWRTTLIGVGTSVGYTLYAYFIQGKITWQGGIACAVWAIFCYLVPDAKNNKDTQAQIEALLDAVSGLKADPAAETAPPTGT